MSDIKFENTACDAALIVSPENRFYYTGFESSDGFLIVTAHDAFFITDGRYIEAAQNTVKDCKVILQEKSAEQIKNILDGAGAKKVAVESDRMTVSDYAMFASALDGIELIADGSLDCGINEARSVKSDDEVEKIVRAQRIAEEAFSHIRSFIREGMTEKEIQLELDYYMLRNGADALSFETIAVSGANGSMPHGVPGSKRVAKGDFITLDFGAVYKGYHSDMTRTVALGNVTAEQEKVYYTVAAAQNAAIEAIGRHVSGKEADEAARKVIEDAGYGEYFTHSTGHGVGVEIHEYPNVSRTNEKPLSAGNVVTAEPGIYIPGKFGVRIEDMILVTENGYRNLTQCPKELIIL
ncbi:MAG: aminopeptidase P family protein [Ruminococcaceae bacterium]|nr:aminopeptidase P family protein [Oscillospiraceae bacterium]